MKNSVKFCLTALTLLSFSCKEKPKEKEENIIELGKLNKETILDQVPTAECYLFVQGKDSIKLSIEKSEDVVTGSLAYKFYEKDKSFGTINGKLNGDILKADYTFQAEGTTSTREVIFMKDGDKFIPGYGETIDKDGKFVFKDNTKLDFNTTQALIKVDCE
ncbi:MULTISPECIES: hypothetical protein [Galbibacter]|uniref:Lipoprotein n=1 Tax=Galbibacter orientalis DSM 19592 TaxID=926559 RepID=I3C9J0_9FLAO|nr:hypothetical protein [Galbibacter orientalis]EIJ40283.1 hypothetical protein JoomaDRAFT_3338 [Galbibacter orientalis DSM 19592]